MQDMLPSGKHLPRTDERLHTGREPAGTYGIRPGKERPDRVRESVVAGIYLTPKPTRWHRGAGDAPILTGLD